MPVVCVYTLGAVNENLQRAMMDSLRVHYPKCRMVGNIHLPDSALTTERNDHKRYRADVLNKVLCHYKSDSTIVVGLFYRADDSKEGFDKVIVGHPHAYHLRKHEGDIVAVWCNADQFARAEGLHGLFTGMIVSELSEALLYQVETTQEELDRENVKLAMRLRSLLDARIPMSEIPKRMLAMDDVHSPLTTFNYRNFHYL